MTVKKRFVETADLLAAYLTFTPRPREVAMFEADMRTLNTTLLHDSIRECTATSKLVAADPPQAQRTAIHAVYTRKVKEMASLFPFIFTTESAVRSAAADALSDIFGRADWWTVVRDAFLAAQDHHHFKQGGDGKKRVCGVAVQPNFVRQVFFCFEHMPKPELKKVLGPGKKDEFFTCVSLTSLWELLKSDWSLGRTVFLPDPELTYSLNKGSLDPSFKLLAAARNEIYHSNAIKNRRQVFTAAEKILDALGLHLGDLDQRLSTSTYTRTGPSVPRMQRHKIPPI